AVALDPALRETELERTTPELVEPCSGDIEAGWHDGGLELEAVHGECILGAGRGEQCSVGLREVRSESWAGRGCRTRRVGAPDLPDRAVPELGQVVPVRVRAELLTDEDGRATPVRLVDPVDRTWRLRDK